MDNVIFCQYAFCNAAQAPFSYSLRTRRVRTKGAILSRERMAPFRSPKRTRGEGPSTPDIAGLGLEELLSLRNQVRCTWLRHESLRVGSFSNRALLS